MDKSHCNLKKLGRLLADRLNLETQLTVLAHLDECQVCRELLYRLALERDADLFVTKSHHLKEV